MNKNCRIIAYFDFDGTLSNKDTLIPFLIYCVGYLKFLTYLPRLLPIVLLYTCRIISNQEAKERTLTIVLKGFTEDRLTEKAKNFAVTHLNKYLVPEHYSKLEWHREHGHQIALVSANLAIYLRFFAELHKINYVIATEIEADNGLITGKLATPNCYGEQKVIRIKDYLLKQMLVFDYAYGYGNSRGDHEMLLFVDEPYYVTASGFEDYHEIYSDKKGGK